MKTSTGRVIIFTAILCLLLLACIAVVATLIHKDPPREVPPPNSVIVSKSGGGQYKTISGALKEAQPGLKILVRPGTYEEQLIIDKPIEIIGDPGETGKAITIRNTSSACVVMQVDHAVIKGLTLEVRAGIRATILKILQARNTIEEPCVDISQGQLVLEDCDIKSEAVAGVGIRGPETSAIIRRCKIHDGDSNGIWITNGATALIEDCDIFGTTWAGIRIEDEALPTVRRCKIHNIQNAGVLATGNAKGTVEECDIFGNSFSGVEVRDDSSVAIRQCKIYEFNSTRCTFTTMAPETSKAARCSTTRRQMF